MSNNIKMKIMNHNVSFFIRPDTGSVNFYFSHKGRKIKGSTGVKSFDDIDVGDITLKISRVIDGRKVKKTSKKGTTFRKLFKDFIEFKKTQGLKDRTIKDYEREGKFLLEYFGSNEIKELGTGTNYYKYHKWKRDYYKKHTDRQTITYVRNGRLVKGRIHTENGMVGIDREINLFRRVLVWGQKCGKIPHNFHIDDWEGSKIQKTETKILTKKQYQDIVSFLKLENPYYMLIVRFANNTGVRYPSELNNIKWKHIDFKRKTISIEGRKRGNRSNRTRVDSLIPMTNRVRDILTELKERPNIPINDDNFVFVNNKGIQVKSINKFWKKTLKHLDIDDDITIYSLRHLFTTRLIKRPDISIKLISELLGHKDTTMVERIYGKWINIESKVNIILESESIREDILEKMNDIDKNNNRQ